MKEPDMPLDSLAVIVFVTAIFTLFGAVLFWADRQTAQLAARRAPDRKTPARPRIVHATSA
jgi:hypothetical protein